MYIVSFQSLYFNFIHLELEIQNIDLTSVSTILLDSAFDAALLGRDRLGQNLGTPIPSLRVIQISGFAITHLKSK